MTRSNLQIRAAGAFNSLYAGLGAKGHDVVSYFAEGRPVPGTDAYVAEYAGLKWQFASAEHRDQQARQTGEEDLGLASGESRGRLAHAEP